MHLTNKGALVCGGAETRDCHGGTPDQMLQIPPENPFMNYQPLGMGVSSS